jgi:hypothetical protein
MCALGATVSAQGEAANAIGRGVGLSTRIHGCLERFEVNWLAVARSS